MDTTQNLLKLGRNIPSLAQAESKTDQYGKPLCPVCKGSRWEFYTIKDGGIEYEYARECRHCKGITTEMVQERRERSGMPCKYQTGVTLDDFSTTIYQEIGGYSDEYKVDKLMKYIKSFTSDFYRWEGKGMGIYLYSRTKGSGKSYLASCMANSIIQKYAFPVKYISASELIDRSREQDGIRDLQDVRILILDDLGAKLTGGNWMDDIMFRVVDSRNSKGKVTVYTSNLKPDELPMDERVVDRIKEKSVQLNLPEVSVRNDKGISDKIGFLKSLKI